MILFTEKKRDFVSIYKQTSHWKTKIQNTQWTTQRKFYALFTKIGENRMMRTNHKKTLTNTQRSIQMNTECHFSTYNHQKCSLKHFNSFHFTPTNQTNTKRGLKTHQNTHQNHKLSFYIQLTGVEWHLWKFCATCCWFTGVKGVRGVRGVECALCVLLLRGVGSER